MTTDKIPVLFYQEGTCALGALISLLWLGKPFRLCRLEDGDSENKDFLNLNALGEVPTLFLDGTILTENVAILQHIALKDLHRGLTFSPGSPQFDQLNRALGFLTSSFHKAFFPLFGAGAFHDDKRVQDQMKKRVINGHLKDVLSHAEEHLLRTTFMFERPMICDAYLFAMARWAEDLYDIKDDFPHIARFQKAMNRDEMVRLALAIENGTQKTAQGPFLGHYEFKTFVRAASARKDQVDRERHDGPYTQASPNELNAAADFDPFEDL